MDYVTSVVAYAIAHDDEFEITQALLEDALYGEIKRRRMVMSRENHRDQGTLALRVGSQSARGSRVWKRRCPEWGRK